MSKKIEQRAFISTGDRETFKQRVLTGLAAAVATQRQLEDKAGIARGMLSHYFRGSRLPKTSDLRHIAEALVLLQGRAVADFAIHPVEALVADTGFARLFALETGPVDTPRSAELNAEIAALTEKLIEAQTIATAEAQLRTQSEKQLQETSLRLDAASRELVSLRSKLAAVSTALESANLEVLQSRATSSELIRARDETNSRAARWEIAFHLPVQDPFTKVLASRQIFTWQQYALALQRERDGLLAHLNDARQKLAAMDGAGARAVLAGLFGAAVGAIAVSSAAKA